MRLHVLGFLEALDREDDERSRRYIIGCMRKPGADRVQTVAVLTARVLRRDLTLDVSRALAA